MPREACLWPGQLATLKCRFPDMKNSSTVAAVAQVGSILFNTPQTLDKLEALSREAAAGGARLAVFPEALLGGYPKGVTFGTTVGSRSAEGREWFRRYWSAAVDVPGPETNRLQALADELDLTLVVGAIERRGGTLFCSTLTFLPRAPQPHIHRKLMPTAAERTIWGCGDGSTMAVLPSPVGRIGCAICWENYMPAYRQHLYNQCVELWCAPTVDDREIWQSSMRHIAYEGRCFVLSACQYLTRADCPADYHPVQGNDPATVLIGGGSVIVSPLGETLAGPLRGREGVLWAELDLGDIVRGKFDLDVAGHYARADIFTLRVNTQSH